MSITDELREFAPHLDLGKVALAGWKEGLLAIADRIDIEHEKALRELNNLADAIADSCVQLPKDANGEYIHIGDVMYDSNESPSEKFNVAIMELNKWGWSLIDSYGERNEPSQCCHHHKPTIEDVLREFGERYCDTVDGCAEESELFAEYAAKLQLKEED